MKFLAVILSRLAAAFRALVGPTSAQRAASAIHMVNGARKPRSAHARPAAAAPPPMPREAQAKADEPTALFVTPFPHSPGFAAGSDTSEAAAKAVLGKSADLRAKVLAELRRTPQTSLQLAESLGERFESVQPRTSELRTLGLIADSGQRGPSRSPRLTAIVWKIAA